MNATITPTDWQRRAADVLRVVVETEWMTIDGVVDVMCPWCAATGDLVLHNDTYEVSGEHESDCARTTALKLLKEIA